MNFGECLEMLKSHHPMARSGWNGKGMYLQLISGDDNPRAFPTYAVKGVEDKDLLSWVGMRTADGKFVPWLASQTDILATDWAVAVK